MKPDLNTIQQEGIISAGDLDTVITTAAEDYLDVVILDATFVLPTSEENPKANFLQERIPGARFFNIKEICDISSPLPHTVPTQKQFDDGMSELGLNKDTFIIVYGQHGMTMGPCRVWWMLRLFGHNRVAVLDGGLPRWKTLGFRTETGKPAEYKNSSYKSQALHNEKLALKEQVIDACMGKNILILDARPKSRFEGTQKEPREGMRSGHIPNSVSCPASSLVHSETGEMKDKEELENILSCLKPEKFSEQNAKIITTCGSGITACVIALALYRIGKEDVAVYDGSWSEWGQENAGTPVTCNG